jgi:hypothetical protein
MGRDFSNQNGWLPGLHFELRLTAFAFQIISCLLCSTIFGKMSRAMWPLDRMLHGPGASASVILPHSQNQNRRDLFWNVEGVNTEFELNRGDPAILVRTLSLRLTALPFKNAGSAVTVPANLQEFRWLMLDHRLYCSVSSEAVTNYFSRCTETRYLAPPRSLRNHE